MTEGRLGKTVVGVLTVIDEEFDAARAALGATTRVPARNYWHGPGGPERFVVGRMADRGNGPAHGTTRRLIEHWRPDIVLLVGIAGGLEGGPAWLGDVIIADYIHYSDFRKITEAGDALRFAAYDQPTVTLRQDNSEGIKTEGRWPERMSVARPANASRHRGDTPRAEVGGIVAGEKVSGDPDHPEQQRLFVTFDSAIGIDMESFGVGRAVHEMRSDPGYNPRLSVIRGVSDIVERRVPRDVRRALLGRMPQRTTRIEVNNEQRRVWKGYASASAAAFAAAIVDEVAP